MAIFSQADLPPDDQPAQQQSQSAAPITPTPVPDQTSDNNTSDIMAILSGLANSIPGAKQIGAGVNGAVDYATGNVKTFGEGYNQNMGTLNQVEQQAKQTNPIGYVVGNLAGTVPQYMVGAGEASAGLTGAKALLAKMAGAGGVGALQGASSSQSQGNDLGTIVGDAATNAGLGALGEGIGGMIMKGIGQYAGHGADIIASEGKSTAADAAKEAAMKDAAEYGDISKMSDEEYAAHHPGITPEKIAQVRTAAQAAQENAFSKAEDATAAKTASETAKSNTIKDIKGGPVANALGYGSAGLATHLLGGSAPESLLTSLVGGGTIKDAAINWATPTLIGGAKGLSKVAKAAPEGMANRAQGTFDALMQFLNQPTDERQQSFNAQMISPQARAAVNSDNPENKR